MHRRELVAIKTVFNIQQIARLAALYFQMQRQMVQPALPRQIGGGVDGRGMLQPGGRGADHPRRNAARAAKAENRNTLIFCWIIANIILIPYIRPVEGIASLYTDLLLGLGNLPFLCWVWRNRRETLRHHFVWEMPLLTLILLAFLTIPALRDLAGGSQTAIPRAFHTTRSAHLPTHYYLNLYLKPLAGESATLRISADTYQALARAQRIRIEYWRHSATLKRFEILDATP